MSKPLLALEAMLLASAFIAAVMNSLTIATALMISAGLVIVIQKWRQ